MTFSEQFEEKFVFRPFEPDGDYSWKPEANPYSIKSFIRSQFQELIQELEGVKNRFRCGACDGAKCEHTHCCQALLKAIELIKKRLQ